MSLVTWGLGLPEYGALLVQAINVKVTGLPEINIDVKIIQEISVAVEVE